jgi:hypothetical protein
MISLDFNKLNHKLNSREKILKHTVQPAENTKKSKERVGKTFAISNLNILNSVKNKL